ncbi:hypothetical protein LJR039_005455 [Pseudorhodoferax sp. LjRoot39]|uniref:hypothetical protein n=1 Tax=Pseudorhodoferax sp. LjRoot39 TaxID=3342328 RepID=UPI003ECFF3B8
MTISVLAVAASSFMRWGSRPRAWQRATAGISNYAADLVTAAGIGAGLATALVAWWAA